MTSTRHSARKARVLGSSSAVFGVFLGIAGSCFGQGLDGVFERRQPLRHIVLNRWTTSDGLPADSLSRVIQTRDGHLWISSFEGLVRFDGINFTTFDRAIVESLAEDGHSFQLRTNGFNELIEDDEGTLWIGSIGGGVLLYRNGRFRSLLPSDDFPLGVRSILIDSRKRVWIGTTARGAYRYQDGRAEPVDAPGAREVTVRQIMESGDGTIWVATEGRGLIAIRDETVSTLDRRHGLVSNAVTSLAERGEALYVGTQDGLARLERDEFTLVPGTSGIEITRLKSFGNRIWVASQQGLFSLNADRGELERLLENDDFQFGTVSDVMGDREGSLWVATYGQGLFQAQPSRFRRFTRADGLASDRINFIEQIDDEFLVGSDNGVVNVVSEEDVARLRVATPLGDVRIRHALRDRFGTLWIASYAGLLEKRGSLERLHTVSSGLPTNQVRVLFEDSGGVLWAGTRNGGLLRRRSDGGFDVLTSAMGLTSDFIFSLQEDAEGNLLIGTYDGLTVRTRQGDFRSYTAADGLASNLVFNTHVARDGSVWLCTDGGLSRMQGGVLKSLSIDEGLPTSSVFDLAEDASGFFWLSTSAGVVRVARQQLDDVLDGQRSTVEVKLFGMQDGLAHRECTGATRVTTARDGSLWFPTLGGISIIDPARLAKHTEPPTVLVHQLVADGRRYRAGDSPISLPAETQELLFDFAAPSFRAPKHLKVRYRLGGLDESWTDAGTDRRARYMSPRAGTYSFRVIAANEDGVWNEQGASLSFEVQPRWYERRTTWAILLAMLLALGRAVHQIQVRAMRRRNERLEELVTELERRNEEMERFSYTVSHDLKSPLITIRGFLGALKEDVAAGRYERVDDDVAPIEEATGKMARLLEDLLELSRVGRVSNEPEWCPMSELAAEAAGQLQGTIDARSARVEIRPAMPRVRVDRHRIVELLQNLLENSLRFARDGHPPTIEVGVRGEPTSPVFYVRDEGIGIPARYQEKVFGLFERLDVARDGTGVGLSIVKRIVEVHGGKIWVESDGVDQGTRFCFTLPETERA